MILGDEQYKVLRTYVLVLFVFLSTQTMVWAQTSNYFCLDIFTLHDFNGAMIENENHPGAANVADFILTEKTKNLQGTVILAAGNMFLGSAESNLSHGKPVVDIMNAIGFDAMCFGEHEFDLSLSVLQARQAQAKFPFLSSNIMNLRTGESANYGLL